MKKQIDIDKYFIYKDEEDSIMIIKGLSPEDSNDFIARVKRLERDIDESWEEWMDFFYNELIERYEKLWVKIEIDPVIMINR